MKLNLDNTQFKVETRNKAQYVGILATEDGADFQVKVYDFQNVLHNELLFTAWLCYSVEYFIQNYLPCGDRNAVAVRL